MGRAGGLGQFVFTGTGHDYLHGGFQADAVAYGDKHGLDSRAGAQYRTDNLTLVQKRRPGTALCRHLAVAPNEPGLAHTNGRQAGEQAQVRGTWSPRPPLTRREDLRDV